MSHFRTQQNGAVLIMAMIMLLVLTMLGVAGMGTSSIEEKMAANSQEIHRAFQVAETGVSAAFNDGSAFNLTSAQTTNGTVASDNHTTVSAFEGWANPPLDSGYSATSFQSAHFKIVSSGASGGGASLTVTAGAFQISPKL